MPLYFRFKSQALEDKHHSIDGHRDESVIEILAANSISNPSDRFRFSQMQKLKKFDVVVSPFPDGFCAQVVRRRTSRGVTIEDSRSGFLTAEEAQAWGRNALSEYLLAREAKKDVRRQNRADSQARKKEGEQWLRDLTYQALAECMASGDRAALAQEELRSRAEFLWKEIVFRGEREGASEKDAVAAANEAVGRQWSDRLERAVLGKLDLLEDGVHALAVANAKRLLNTASVFKVSGRDGTA
jgi:hypothetical protein